MLTNFSLQLRQNLWKRCQHQKGIFNVTSLLFVNFYRKRNPNQYSFTLQTVSEDFVYKELSSLNITKSTGLDEIPAHFIKDEAAVLTAPITFIINQSIVSGTVPDIMKDARVKQSLRKIVL